ncbi:Zinc finger FYVE domain-containing protein 26, partial [Stegodyphus mimosarum]
MEKKCDPDVFIEALFMPVLKNVQLSSLKHHLTNVDQLLSVWSPYLFATCRHLERLKYLNVLYEVQLFMGDYIRAAKSAINFYLAPAPSYRILFERHRHLRNAKKHYEEYVKENKDENSGKEYKKRKNMKMLSVKEVESYIQVITLQEEVSSFFQLCASQKYHAFLYEAGFVDSESSKSSYCPPTLFGNVEKKTEVALMVLLNAINTDEGFDLTVKIIQTFNLDATAILSKAGRELIRINQKRQIPYFLDCVKCFFTKIVKVDEVILECVAELSKQNGDVEDIIKMLTSESNKINAYLMCGKLKSAYLLAIKLNSALHVRRVMVAAEQGGQDSIQRFCKKWLETNSLKMKPKESASHQQF